MRRLLLMLILLPCLGRAADQAARVQFYADPVLVESGLIQHIRPRFSLKTQVGVDVIADPDGADLTLGAEGTALFAGLGQTWKVAVHSDHPGAQRFADWLTSKVGRRTILGFAPDGQTVFSEPVIAVRAAPVAVASETAVQGQKVSYDKCRRCHVTETGRGMVSLGSTPSFAVLRGFDDWDVRFAGFYALKPHPAFTQLQDVTDPFPPDRPSPIAPISLTLEELDAIMAYVAAMVPADLGDALRHQ